MRIDKTLFVMYDKAEELIFDEIDMVINYKNYKYPYRIIMFENNDMIISTIALEQALLTKDYVYVDSLAEYIDECIFFFVDDDEIYKDDNFILNILSRVVSTWFCILLYIQLIIFNSFDISLANDLWITWKITNIAMNNY